VKPIALVGSLSRDRVGGRPPRVGGMPYWSARALRALGAHAWVVTKCSSADRAALLRPLVALGLPVAWRAAERTTGFSFRYEGEERVMEVDSVGDAWTPADVAEVRAEWVHVGPLLRGEFDTATLAALARGNRRISFDGQGLVRVPAEGPLRVDADYDRDLLRHVTVLKLAEDEAETLLGEVTAESLATLNVPEVVVTHGSRGAWVFHDGHLSEIPARAVDRDPTGAGDSFAAAYAASRAAGYRPTAAARRATALVGGLLAPRR
jgi:sugar/nucleoside kinase (ribokinase family)